MTLRELNDLLREDEVVRGEDPMTRLVALVALLRTARQGEIATNEGIDASVRAFRRLYGAVTTETVDRFSALGDALDVDIPMDQILAVMEAD